MEFLLLLLILSPFLLTSHGVSGCTGDTPCRLDSNTLRWFTIGDWGGLPVWPYYSYAESTVGSTLAREGLEKDTHFQLGIGDNFYFTGVHDEYDHRFKETFEDVFTGEALNRPWYILAGNHDHYGNVSGQIAYSKHSSRWNYPSLFYVIKYELSDGTRLDFVMIDTIELCGNTKDLTFANVLEYLETRSVAPTGPRNATAAQSHWLWIHSALQASTADYLFVVGHYPVWSVGEHGPTTCLVDKLHPLLFQHKVTAYITGHDHTLQEPDWMVVEHLRERKDGVDVHFFISGAGAFIDSSTKHKRDVPNGSLQFHYPAGTSLLGKLGLTRGGFLYSAANATAAIFSFSRGDGKSLYSATLRPRPRP